MRNSIRFVATNNVIVTVTSHNDVSYRDDDDRTASIAAGSYYDVRAISNEFVAPPCAAVCEGKGRV